MFQLNFSFLVKNSERFDSYVLTHTKVNAVNFCVSKKRAAEKFP